MVLVLFSSLMLRSMIRSASATSTAMPSIPLTIPLPEESSSKPSAPPKKRLEKKPTLNEELAEIVRDNPDTAANILRNWIGNAN